MEKKVKKPLKASQKKTLYRFGQKVTFGSEFISIATPYIIMGAINFDEWFRTTEGWKVGLGGSLAIALMCICVFSITKKREDKDSKTGGFLTLLMAWIAVAFIFMLLANIMNDIATIMFFGAIGIAGALGLEITSKKLGEKADLYEEAIRKVKGEVIENEVKKEIYKDVVDEMKEQYQRRAVE